MGAAPAWGRLQLQLSARTMAASVQAALEGGLERRRRAVLGPPPGVRLALFIDDLAMPEVEEYGASPPLELVRQLLPLSRSAPPCAAANLH